MIPAITTQNSSYRSFVTDTSEHIHKIQKTAYESLWIPISIGSKVGFYSLSFGLMLSPFLSMIPGVDNFLANPDLAEKYVETVTSSFWKTAIEGPFLEEVIFRCFIQDAFKWIAKQIFPDQDVEIFSHTIKLSTLVAVVATSILFGLAHLGSGIGIAHVIIATLLGITYGVLRENYGLHSSIAAHITNNAIVYKFL